MTPVESPRLFDDRVHCYSARWSVDDLDMLESRAGEMLVPERMESAVPQRRAEFLAGRLCAAEALRAAGCEQPVGFFPAPARAPRWPDGYTGSITHTRGFVSVAVARTDVVASIGIDSECVTRTATLRRVTPMVLTDSELARLEADRDRRLPREVAVTLAFSFKESLYKCLHPVEDVSFGFQAVEVVVKDPDVGTASLRLLQRIGNIGAGTEFVGRWTEDEAQVHTGVLI